MALPAITSEVICALFTVEKYIHTKCKRMEDWIWKVVHCYVSPISFFFCGIYLDIFPCNKTLLFVALFFSSLQQILLPEYKMFINTSFCYITKHLGDPIDFIMIHCISNHTIVDTLCLRNRKNNLFDWTYRNVDWNIWKWLMCLFFSFLVWCIADSARTAKYCRIEGNGVASTATNR